MEFFRPTLLKLFFALLLLTPVYIGIRNIYTYFFCVSFEGLIPYSYEKYHIPLPSRPSTVSCLGKQYFFIIGIIIIIFTTHALSCIFIFIMNKLKRNDKRN